jgi:hypothetical protein
MLITSLCRLHITDISRFDNNQQEGTELTVGESTAFPLHRNFYVSEKNFTEIYTA